MTTSTNSDSVTYAVDIEAGETSVKLIQDHWNRFSCSKH